MKIVNNNNIVTTIELKTIRNKTKKQAAIKIKSIKLSIYDMPAS